MHLLTTSVMAAALGASIVIAGTIPLSRDRTVAERGVSSQHSRNLVGRLDPALQALDDHSGLSRRRPADASGYGSDASSDASSASTLSLGSTTSTKIIGMTKHKWLAVGQMQTKIKIDGVNGCTGLFLRVQGVGVGGGHITPTAVDADTQATVDEVINYAHGRQVTAIIHAPTQAYFNEVKAVVKQTFPHAQFEKIDYQLAQVGGWWGFTADVSDNAIHTTYTA